MLKRLRWQLTGAYMAATLALIGLVGGGTYLVLQNYFQQSIELAMQHRMVIQFHLFGVSIPHRLIEAEEAWFQQQVSITSEEGQSQEQIVKAYYDWIEHEQDEDYLEEISEHAFESDQNAIFVMPLDINGELLFNPNPYSLPMPPALESSQRALEKGYDWDTVRLPGGGRARVLSYRTEDAGAPAVLQVGRLLTDQDQVLKNLVFGILIAGGVSMLAFGGISWWLAGKTLVPAQRAWDNQQSFIANASHELRAPLSLIRASVEVAKRGRLPEQADALLGDVVTEVDYMNSLVEDLLLLSRLDTGHLALEEAPLLVGELVSGTARMVGPLAEQQGIRLQVQAGEAQVSGDPKRLRQVLIILLDNALQHTAAGGQVRLESRRAGKRVEISVSDTGVGIAPQHLERIFERFYQVQPPAGSVRRSNGLGLSIARALVEKHGGTLMVKSKEGEGSTFTISLPVVEL